jgi:hypothetical protein
MSTAKKANPPKGGKKGGAVFPRMSLKEGATCAKRLVSKAHVAAISQDVLFSGVLQAKGGRGAEKSSAMKQFGFLSGDSAAGYTATPLAKQVAAAPSSESSGLLRESALKPKIFKALFDTFHGDVISKAKLRQRASELNVHPDMLELCVDLYTQSIVFAGLATVDGENVAHLAASSVSTPIAAAEEEVSAPEEEATRAAGVTEVPEEEDVAKNVMARTQRGNAVMQVNITVDSSLDTEKLAKQLELLRKFRVI